jgi:hypothetical protein
MTAPTSNLLRALDQPAELRADGEAERVMFGEAARFSEWTEINSAYEGNFLEQIAPGAFVRTVAERGDQIKVLYDHGNDPMIGNKPLGSLRSLKETRSGLAYEVDLFDASYVRELEPALKAGALGASFRFAVRDEDWAQPSRASNRNPNRLPERTITDVDLYEFGPVTFPAYASASAGMRSRTDEWLEGLLTEPQNLARLLERMSSRAAFKLLSDLPDHVGSDDEPTVLAESDHVDSTYAIARARIAAFLLH